jgi:hypothetical protein
MQAVGAALLSLVVFALGKIIWLLRACLLAYFAALCITLCGGYSQFFLLDRYIAWINVVARPLQKLLRENLPTTAAGVDLAPFILRAIMVVRWLVLESQWARWRFKAAAWRTTARHKRKLAKIRKTARKQAGQIGAMSVPPTPSDREELLELYARTNKALDAQKRWLSFLSIDVVGSTRMKEDEDAADFAPVDTGIDGCEVLVWKHV